MFLDIKETWYEYVQFSKHSKISQPTASQSATRGEKIVKEKLIKTIVK